MHIRYNMNSYNSPVYPQNDQRFIGPIFPFLGGALIGYIAGRPQYNYSYPIYYPSYYPNYYYPGYYTPYNTYTSTR